MKSTKLILLSVALATVWLPHCRADALLGAAESFAVLAHDTVTSTGTAGTSVKGDLGVAPGTSITGFTFSSTPGPGILNGSYYTGPGSLAATALTAANSAYSLLLGETPSQDLSGQVLGVDVLSLNSGVWKFASTAQLTGTLTLDAHGDSAARFDFQVGTALTTATDAALMLLNGALADNVYWQIGSSATLGVGTFFSGSILADQSITLNTSARLDGRAVALNGAVTLDANQIAVPLAIPEPTAVGLLALCAAGTLLWRRLPRQQRRMQP